MLIRLLADTMSKVGASLVANKLRSRNHREQARYWIGATLRGVESSLPALVSLALMAFQIDIPGRAGDGRGQADQPGIDVEPM